MIGNPSRPSFKNEFDLTTRKLDEVILKETNVKDKCIVWDKKNNSKAYSSFLLSKNTKSKIICELSFYKSKSKNKYIPRPIFKKCSLEGDIRKTRSKDKVIIGFDKSDEALTFWKLITFLYSYKEIVDIGEFEKEYKVIQKNSYFIEFENKSEKEKAQDIIKLLDKTKFSPDTLVNILFTTRKRNLKAFLLLLQNKKVSLKLSQDAYKEKYRLRNGEEYIWQHFLKNNKWILGLNTDFKFFYEFYEEQKLGVENSLGSGSPKVDFFGVSDFTILVELKTASTQIFKKSHSKGRANTWDFTSDFIEAVSQCLGQKVELDKSFEHKSFINPENNKRLQKDSTFNEDSKILLVIGNKKNEFPIHDFDNTNINKYHTFERFRRNLRNVDIITYDELFERSYYLVFGEKISRNWFNGDSLKILD